MEKNYQIEGCYSVYMQFLVFLSQKKTEIGVKWENVKNCMKICKILQEK